MRRHLSEAPDYYRSEPELSQINCRFTHVRGVTTRLDGPIPSSVMDYRAVGGISQHRMREYNHVLKSDVHPFLAMRASVATGVASKRGEDFFGG
jgi:hypothetical protein